MGGDGDLLPAAARRARRPPGPRDALADAGAVRPARGRRRRASASSPSCARCGPRRTGATSRRPRTRVARELERSAGCTRRRPSASRRAAATSSAAFAPHVTWTSLGHPRRAAAAGHRRRRAAPGRRRDRLAPRALRRTGTAASGCRSAGTRRGSTRCSRRPACTRRASTSPTSSATARRPAAAAAQRRRAAARADRPRADGPRVARRRLPVGGDYRDTTTHTEHRHTPWAVDGAPYDPARAAEQVRAHARDFAERRRGGWRRRARGLRARHRAARALLARGGRLAGGDDRGVRGGGRRAGAARRRAGRRRRRAGPAELPATSWGSRATSPPGARRRPPSWRGRRARRSCACSPPAPIPARARCASCWPSRPPTGRFGVDARDAPARTRASGPSGTPPSSSARSPIRPESVPVCATLHLLSTCRTVNFRVS